jgi:regulatory protein
MNEYQKARNTVIRLLKFRPRSEAEIYERLSRKQVPAEIIVQVTEDFKACGLIDDQDFARKWAAYREARSFGPLRIRQELVQKGIDPDIIKSVLEKTDDGYDELAAARNAAARRVEQYRTVSQKTARKRLFDFLMRRGFKTEIAYQVTKELITWT